jgi:hypothetical protein
MFMVCLRVAICAMNRSAIPAVNDGRKFTFIEIINRVLRIAGARPRGARRATLPRFSP